MIKDELTDPGEEQPLCEKCGTVLEEEKNGKLICPSCDQKINFFGEDENK